MAKHKVRIWPKIRRFKNVSGLVYYFVDLRRNGKGERKFFPTKKEADAFAAQKREERQNSGLTAFSLDENVRQEVVAQWRRLQEVGATFTQAVDFYLKHVHPHGIKITVSAGIEKWIQTKRDAGRRDEYLRTQTIVLKNFAKDHGDRQVREIGIVDIETWMRGKAVREKWSQRTKWNYLRDLKSFWRWCVDQGFATLNPVDRIEPPRLDDSPPGILMTTQASDLLLKAAGIHGRAMVPYIAIGLFAGLRSAEIERLDWSEIDLESRLIEVKGVKSKTRQRRHVAISDNLLAWLTPFKIAAGRVAPKFKRLDLQLTGLAEKAKITPWPKNALRHSFASYHLAQHKDAGRTALELGHYNQDMLFRNYRELVKPAAAKLYWEIMPVF